MEPTDDHEPLDPHADIDEDRDRKKADGARPDPLEEKEKGRHHVAEAHDPEEGRIVADSPEEEGLSLEDVAAVPGDKRLHDVGVADDEGHEDRRLGHLLQGVDGNDRFETKDPPEGYKEGEHHGKAGMDGAGHKIGRKDGAVVARYDGKGEIPGDNAVDGDDERCAEAGQQEVGHAVVVPLPVGAGPAEGEEAVYLLRRIPAMRSLSVARSGTSPVYQKRRLAVR